MELQQIMEAHIFCEKENDGFAQLFNDSLKDILYDSAENLADAREQTIAAWPKTLKTVIS